MMEATTGLVIKGLREKYGYTQDKVANYLGIKREMISFYENEGREIPLDVLEKLSEEDWYFFIFYIDSITYWFLNKMLINKKDNSSWSWLGWFILMFIWIIFIISIFSDNSSNNTNTTSSNNTDYSNRINTANSNNTINNNSNKCLLNWIEYTKPNNSSCITWDKYNAWKCNTWYTEKNNYCWCNSWNYNCPIYLDTSDLDNRIAKLEKEVNSMYVNQYSDSSVNNYNSKVNSMNKLIEERNKKLNDNCSCQ